MILSAGVCWGRPRPGDRLKVTTGHSTQSRPLPAPARLCRVGGRGRSPPPEERLGRSPRHSCSSPRPESTSGDLSPGRRVDPSRGPAQPPRTAGALLRPARSLPPQVPEELLRGPGDDPCVALGRARGRRAQHGVGLPAPGLPIGHDTNIVPGIEHRAQRGRRGAAGPSWTRRVP